MTDRVLLRCIYITIDGKLYLSLETSDGKVFLSGPYDTQAARDFAYDDLTALLYHHGARFV
jgi:hypothetical protein